MGLAGSKRFAERRRRMDLLLRITGAAVVLAAIIDIFFTVLFPGSGYGPIRKPVGGVVWQVFRFLGNLTGGRRRRWVLSFSGPVLIGATMMVWFALLVVGWAMIYKPALGTGIRANSGVTDTSWTTALYVSGFNLTTLGVGDVAPSAAPYRILSVIQAGFGFAFFSMSIAYFLSVYSSLTGRNAFAQGLHHLSGRTDDAAELLACLADGADLSSVREHLASKAEFVREIYQTHRFYPVLRYFHYTEPFYALPRMLLVMLDTVTLIRSALNQEQYSRLIASPALNDFFETAKVLLEERVPHSKPRPPSQAEQAQWRQRYSAALRRMEAAGIRVRSGAEDYVALRAEWHQPVYDLAKSMLHQWDVIEQN